MPASSRRREPVDVPRLEADPPEPGEDVHGAATKIAPMPTALIAEIMTGELASSPLRSNEHATSRPPQSGIRARLPNLSFEEEEEEASGSFSPTTLSEVPDPNEGIPTLALPPKLVSDVIRQVDLRAAPTPPAAAPTGAPPPLPAIVPPSPYAAAVPIAWADSPDAPPAPVALPGASSRLTDRELAIAIAVGLVAFVVLVAATLVVLFS